MKINTEKFVAWLQYQRDTAKKIERDCASVGNYAEALKYSSEAWIYRYILEIITNDDVLFSGVDWLEGEHEEDENDIPGMDQ